MGRIWRACIAVLLIMAGSHAPLSAQDDAALVDHRAMVDAIYAGDVGRVDALLEDGNLSSDRYWEYVARAVTSARIAGLLGRLESGKQYEIAKKFTSLEDFDINHRPGGHVGRSIPARVAFAFFGDGNSDGTHHLAFLEHLMAEGAETAGLWHVAQNGCDSFFSDQHHLKSSVLAELAARTCKAEPAQCGYPDYEIKENGSGYALTGEEGDRSDLRGFVEWRVGRGNGSCAFLLDALDSLE